MVTDGRIGGSVLKCVSQKKKVSGDPVLLGHGLMDWWESLKMCFSTEKSPRRPCLAWSLIDGLVGESENAFLKRKKSQGEPALLGHGWMDWWESLKMRFSTEKSLTRPCLAWSQIDGLVGES